MYQEDQGEDFVEYTPFEPQGHIITSDPYFALMANDDGEGFVYCGDGVLVVPFEKWRWPHKTMILPLILYVSER